MGHAKLDPASKLREAAVDGELRADDIGRVVAGQVEGRFGRAATKWFSFDVPVNPAHPLTLIVTYSNENRGPSAGDVLVDGKKLGEQAGPRRSPE